MFKPWCERGISLIDDVKYDLRYFFVKCCKLLLERSFLFNKAFVYIQKKISNKCLNIGEQIVAILNIIGYHSNSLTC